MEMQVMSKCECHKTLEGLQNWRLSCWKKGEIARGHCGRRVLVFVHEDRYTWIWAQVRLFPSRLIQGANILSRYHSPQALLVETCCLQHVHTMYKSIWPTRHARSQTHTWQWTHGYDYVCVFVCSTCTCMNATIFLLLIFWVHGTYPKQNAPQEWRNARNGMRMCLSGPAAWSSAIWSWQAIRSSIRRDTKGIHRVFMQHKGLSTEFTAYIQHLKCTGPNSFQANGWLTWSHCMYTCEIMWIHVIT